MTAQVIPSHTELPGLLSGLEGKRISHEFRQRLSVDSNLRRSPSSKRNSMQWGPIVQLPDDVILYIFSHLHARELAVVAQVSRYWRRLSGDMWLWRQMYLSRWPSAADRGENWRQRYVHDDKVERNWFSGKHRMRALQGHVAPVSCVKFWGNLLVSSSLDCTLKIWFLNSGLCVHTFRAHTRAVWAHAHDDARLLSVGDDRALIVSDIVSGEVIGMHTGHTQWVHALHYDGVNQAVTGSADKNVRLWDLRSGSSQVIASHPVYIEAVDRCGHSVASGSLDGTATLTDLRMLPGAQSLQPSLTPQQHPQQGAVATWRTAPIMELQYVNEGRIVSAHANPNIVQIWNPEVALRTGQPEHILTGHTEVVTCVQADDSKIVSGSRDCTMRVWDPSGRAQAVTPLGYRTDSREHIVSHNRNAVVSLAIESGRMAVGAADWLIRLHYFDI